MAKYKKGETVKVQLGPNIEAATILRSGQFGQYTVRLSNGDSMRIAGDKIVETGLPAVYGTPPVEESQLQVMRDETDAHTLINGRLAEEVMRAQDAGESMRADETDPYVIADEDKEWHGQVQTLDPLQETGRKYAEANPDQHIRWLGDAAMKRRGKRDYVDVIGPDKKPVTVNGMRLGRIPKHIHEQREALIVKDTDSQSASKQEAIQQRLAEAGREVGISTAALDPFDTAKTLRDGIHGKTIRR